MERADQRAEGTALAVRRIAAQRSGPRDRAPLILDLHPGFVRLPPFSPATPRPKRRRPALLAAILIVGGLTAALAFRQPVVAAMPWLGGVYAAIGLPVNLVGLELDGVRASRVFRGGYEQLRIEGAIVSVSRETVTLPQIEIVLLGPDGVEIGRRNAAAAADVIAPRGAIRFAAEFPDLPAEATTITVRLGDGPPFEVQ